MPHIHTHPVQYIKTHDTQHGTSNIVEQFASLLKRAGYSVNTTTLHPFPTQVEWVDMGVTFKLTLVNARTLEAAHNGHLALVNIKQDKAHCEEVIALERHRVRNRIELPNVLVRLDASDKRVTRQTFYQFGVLIASQFGGAVPPGISDVFTTSIPHEQKIEQYQLPSNELAKQLQLCLLA